jgi:hypothetical protein
MRCRVAAAASTFAPRRQLGQEPFMSRHVEQIGLPQPEHEVVDGTFE